MLGLLVVKLKWWLTEDTKEIAVLQDIVEADAQMPIKDEERRGPINPFCVKLCVAVVDYSAKKFCKDISICEEAKVYHIQYGMKNLDWEGDGVPCEKLYNWRLRLSVIHFFSHSNFLDY